MGGDFKTAFWNAKKSINKVLLIDSFLEACILFLLSYTMISIAGFLDQKTTLISIAIGVGYFILKSLRNTFTDKVELIGEQYPQLYEELLTARENSPGKNQVITDLHEEAVKHMNVIEEAAFFEPRPVTMKTAIVLVLCLVIILTAPFNLQEVPLVKQTIEKVSKTRIALSLGPPQEIEGSGPSGEGVVESKGELFGQKRTIEEGIVAAKFTVATSNFEVNLQEEDDTSDEFKFDSVFPSEIGTPDPELFAESIPKEQQELVKNYFRITAEG